MKKKKEEKGKGERGNNKKGKERTKEITSKVSSSRDQLFACATN